MKSQRSLSLTDAIGLGIGAMISGGVFVLTGLAGSMAGPAAIISFALGGMLALMTALSFAELAPAVPRAGGPYEYVREAFGRLAGFHVGSIYWFGYTAAAATYATAFAIYAQRLVGGSQLAMAMTLIVLLILSNAVAGDVAARFGTILTMVKTAVLAAFAAVGLFMLDGQNLRPFAPQGAPALLEAAGVLFVCYLGFGLITTSAEEIRQPERNLPRAVLLSVTIVALIYMGVMTAVVGGLPYGALTEDAVAAAAAMWLGQAGELVIVATALVATATATNACIMATARMLFAMGREGVLPGLLARIHARWRTPLPAVLVSGVVMLVLTTLKEIAVLAALAALAALWTFAGVNLSLVILRRTRPNLIRPFRAPLYPLLQVLAAAACLVLAATLDPRALTLVAGVVAASLLAYRVREGGLEPDRKALAAAWRALVEEGIVTWATWRRGRFGMTPARELARRLLRSLRVRSRL